MFPYKEFERVEREKIRRSSKKREVKQCVNCGSFKNLTDGETVIYTKDRNLKFVAVCDIHCKKSFVKREISDLQNKIEWLKNELEE
ncbi:MAG: hypothetical protein ACRC7N_00950 [Clostridium sp.]